MLISLPEDIARETLIALRDRRYTLQAERRVANSETVLDIIDRQALRVEEAGRAIAKQLGEVF